MKCERGLLYNTQNTRIDVSNLPNGIYFTTITNRNANTSITKKVLVSR